MIRSSMFRVGILLVIAFSLVITIGTVAKAAPPIDIVRLADALDSTRLAKVDASGNVSVSVSNLPPAGTPFQTHVIATPANTTGATQTASFTVPAGQRLEIQYISVHVASQSSTGVDVIVQTQATGVGDAFFRLDMRRQEPFGLLDRHVGEHKISAFAGGGSTVVVTITRSNVQFEMASTVDVVGRLTTQ